MGILRLFKHSDLVVEYNDRENSDLFDFGEPENAALGQPNSLISGALSGALTSGQCTPLPRRRKV